MNKISLSILLVLLLVLSVSDCSKLFAQTYQWTDADGSLHFSDSPPINTSKNKKSLPKDEPRDKPSASSPQTPTTAAENQVKHKPYRSAAEISDSKIYRVLIKTKFVVPSSGVRIDKLRVLHALPPKKEWSGTDTQVGGETISWIPSAGQQQYKESHDSHHIVWDQRSLTPGSILSFESQFTVRSQIRKFDPKKAPTSWEDYLKTSLPDYDKRQDINVELVKIADRIKATNSPPAAVLEFSKWLRLNMTYDASVSYPSKNVADALKNRRGQCGHYAEILMQLCSHVGIPIRRVSGLNLHVPNGVTALLSIRADYTNVHTWVEVYFPQVGWVEVEPSAGARAFTIPARYIQNNKWFQNYAIWISQNGRWKNPEWRYQSGSYVSNYGVENIISYEEL